MADRTQACDLDVTKRKFNRELKEFKEQSDLFTKKGIELDEIAFPYLFFTFCAPHLSDAPPLVTIRFDFTNYDVEPISLLCVDKVTHFAVDRKQIKIKFLQPWTDPVQKENFVKKNMAAVGNVLQQFLGQLKIVGPVNVQMGIPENLELLLPTSPPFFCFPGIYEYHQHEAHSGDNWFRHRTREGSLNVILNQLYVASTLTIKAYNETSQVFDQSKLK